MSRSVTKIQSFSDFELSIAKLTKKEELAFYRDDIRSKFVNDFSDVVDDLRNYLKQEQDSIDYSKYKIDFKSTLNGIKKELPTINQSAIDKKYNVNLHQHDTVNILTLNYTNVMNCQKLHFIIICETIIITLIFMLQFMRTEL